MSMIKIRNILSLLLLIGISLTADAGDLVIVHTNDTHSRIMSVGKLQTDSIQAGKGGFVRRSALIKSLRKEYPGLLLFDSGDFSQGSAYYSLYKGEVEVRLMSEMGYDAVAIGNHEFDCGLENMKRIFEMASFPVVCANYDFTGTVLEGIVKPYVVLERGGLRIGVFGLSPRLEGYTSGSNFAGVVYEDPVSAANRVASQLKEQEKCDLVICLSHLGWDIEGTDDTELIPATHHINVVLGGHSHTLFDAPVVLKDADGRNVVCNQMGVNGINVGMLRLELRQVQVP